MLNLVTQVARQNVENLPATNIATTQQLAYIPRSACFTFDFFLGKQVHTLREMAAEIAFL